MAMDNIANEDVFWALFEVQVGEAESIQRVSRVLRNLAVGRRPSESWVGAYQALSNVPVPAAGSLPNLPNRAQQESDPFETVRCRTGRQRRRNVAFDQTSALTAWRIPAPLEDLTTAPQRWAPSATRQRSRPRGSANSAPRRRLQRHEARLERIVDNRGITQ
jgi:hypothetical protein